MHTPLVCTVVLEPKSDFKDVHECAGAKRNAQDHLQCAAFKKRSWRLNPSEKQGSKIQAFKCTRNWRLNGKVRTAAEIKKVRGALRLPLLKVVVPWVLPEI